MLKGDWPAIFTAQFKKPTDTVNIFGMAEPVAVAQAQWGIPTTDRLAELERRSDDLQRALLGEVAKFLAAHPDMKHSEKMFVVFNAGTAVCADWFCRVDTLNNSVMDMQNGMDRVVELLQNNFADRQQELYDRIGRHIH